MRSVFLFLMMILGSLEGVAQSYACIDPTSKRYFINGAGYLRGIRIDSINTINGTTYLKPFRTARGAVNSSFPPPLNPTGGSWIGDDIMVWPNGSTRFKNFLNDTIVIETQAGLGNSWMFYDDSANIHFEATVVSIDTMTVLGVLDSVKKISIVAKNAANVVQPDALNNFPILLSKNHGFVTVFDLYCFP